MRLYDRLQSPAHALSGGQQQRCVWRVFWLWSRKSFCWMNRLSALDPVSTAKIEQTLQELKKEFTIILVPQ